MGAYYESTAAEFIAAPADAILGALSRSSGQDVFASQFTKQINAWEHEIGHLKEALSGLLITYSSVASWWIILEYHVPRRRKRVDAIILAGQLIFCIEFKTEDRSHLLTSQRQVEDYALDLRDFHEQSHGLVIVPIVVAARAPAKGFEKYERGDVVRPVALSNRADFAGLLSEIVSIEPSATEYQIDGGLWSTSDYRPVPTIIEAAESLYANHDVREIAHSHAGAENLTRTSDRLVEAIQDARKSSKKVICLVTGVPGAGKTLAGLNVVHNTALWHGGMAPGVLLSGNGPLVRIVTAAIAKRSRMDLRTSTTLIQGVHAFTRFALEHPGRPPSEKVVVFDEAQRAWDATQNFKKTGRNESEPATMLSIMDRHKDWAVLIALVGGGQEINTGEAGLTEWGRTLASHFSRWQIVVSPQAMAGDASVSGQRLFESGITGSLNIEVDPALHLNVPLRSFRAVQLAQWVEAVLGGRPEDAAVIATELKRFPMRLTRSLEAARSWLRKRARGFRRCGLVASSGALRLRAHGLELSSGFRTGNSKLYEHWFLAEPDDIRSSNQMEVAASEFDCQGLELDWVGVCWGGDFTYNPQSEEWNFLRLIGPGWKRANKSEDRRYILNKYRVLLTRARQGMVIWVPTGSASDDTRTPGPLDATAEYLMGCGLELLE